VKIIASWTQDEYANLDQPSCIQWADGSPATHSDFKKHQLDTHSFRVDKTGRVEQHIFPEIVALVTFDHWAMDWVVTGPAVVTAALELYNPNAKDDEIIAELYTFPIVYRANIVRVDAPAASPTPQVS
jgi:hypothetical protein